MVAITRLPPEQKFAAHCEETGAQFVCDLVYDLVCDLVCDSVCARRCLVGTMVEEMRAVIPCYTGNPCEANALR